jgi:hypothetical protein
MIFAFYVLNSPISLSIADVKVVDFSVYAFLSPDPHLHTPSLEPGIVSVRAGGSDHEGCGQAKRHF